MPDQNFYPNGEGLDLNQIAKLSGAVLSSDLDKTRRFYSVASLNNANENDIVYCEKKSFIDNLKQTKAGLCFVTEDFKNYVPANVIAAVVKKPALAHRHVAAVLYPFEKSDALIHKTAIIDPSATIGAGTSIGAYSVIGHNVKIGENCRIDAHCTIAYSHIGDKVTILPGTRIGQDGFGYIFDGGRHYKIPQLGRVMIGNDVEIGANVTIDRGTLDDTIIGDNCIIDNLVQIGHNVVLGRGVILVAQSGVAGSSRLDNYAVVAAQGGIADHLHIGEGAQVGAQAGVMRDIPPGARMMGSPAQPVRQYFRQVSMLEKMINSKVE